MQREREEIMERVDEGRYLRRRAGRNDGEG
jgi:hypothetical protein